MSSSSPSPSPAAPSSTDYVPPKVWQNPPATGQFASINKPTAGAQFERVLPVGKHNLQLYSLATPNGVKVTIMLEELLELGHSGAEYDAWPIKIMAGDQFSSGFVDLNPNSKIPVLLDRSNPDQPLRVFESGAILLHLADKFKAFLPDGPARTEAICWLFWLHGSAPFVGGGFGHFYAYAPSKLEYPINRYTMETKRLLDVLNRRLQDHAYLAGDEYSIADMATWPWFGGLVIGNLYSAAEFLNVEAYPHVIRWAKAIDARPAVQRGKKVNRTWGALEDQLHERHDASDFELLTEAKKQQKL
jgi:GSH-dependent disulfide-bond oxidoreductase